MSKAKMEAVKELISEKRYDEARKLLEGIDHPTAKKWLLKLDEVAPIEQPSKPYKAGSWIGKRRIWIILGFLLACFLTYLIGSNPELAKQRDATSTSQAIAQAGTQDARNAMATATAIIQAGTEFAQKAEQTLTAAVDATNFALTPSATFTDTPLPSATFTPSNTPPSSPTVTETSLPTATVPTAAPPETWYVISTANLRECPRTDCSLVVQLQTGTEVVVIGWIQGEAYKGSDVWQRISYNDHEVYVHGSLVSANRPVPTSAPVQIQNQPQPTSAPAQQSFICPSNCTEAVNRGVSAQQAAQCGLDRDGDGVACYGD